MTSLRMLLVLLCVLLSTRAVLADTPDQEAARTLFREGLAAHEAHDYAQALAKFRAAYRRWKNPKILANIGTEAWELGHYAVAANAYDRFLAEAPADAPDRADVEKALREVLPKVGTLVGKLTGPAQSVTVDGQAVQPSSIGRLHVEPGRHAVVAVGVNGDRVEQQVEVAAGARVFFSLRLEAENPSTPASAQPAEPETPVTAPRRPRSSLPWIVGGVGVASLIASGVLYSMRSSTDSELKTECISTICPSSSQSKIDKANRLGAASAITFGVGVASLGVAAYLFLKPSGDAPRETRAVGFGITASPRAASATLAGRF
jgi:hypothetical protein